MKKTRVHLVRHGEVDPAWHGRIYGGLDVDLAPAGRERFDRLAADLARIRLTAVYASPLVRARDGAERIAARQGLEVRIDARFAEIDRGAWTGVRPEDLDATWPGATARYLADPGSYRVHGGESHDQLRDRVRPALDDVAASHTGGESLVVCHSQVIRALVADLLRIPGDRSLNLINVHGGITTLDRYEDGVWCVQQVNAPTIRDGDWGGRTFKP